MQTKIKNYLVLVFQISILFLFFYAGNWIQTWFHLSIPGSIIGMLLLFLSLCFKIIPLRWIEHGASFMLKILMLCFIPTAVGIMNYPSLFSLQGLCFFLAVILSTALSIVVTGKFVTWIQSKQKLSEENQ